MQGRPRERIERVAFWGSEGQSFGDFWGSAHGQPDAYYFAKVEAGTLEPTLPWGITVHHDDPDWEEPDPPHPPDRLVLLLEDLRRQRNAGGWRRDGDGQLRLHDGIDLDERPRWIDDRSLDKIEQEGLLADSPRTASSASLAAGLRPFIDRRTDKQRLTLHARYWEGATIRDTSALLGSDTSGTRAGSAQANERQACKMLRQELLAAFAPDDDPDALPQRAPLHRDSHRSARTLTSVDKDGSHDRLPPPEPVRTRWQQPQPDLARPEPAEWERRNRASLGDLQSMENWKQRGYVSGPPDHGRAPAGSAGFVDIGKAASIKPAGEVPTTGAAKPPPDTNARPWRTPYPQLSPAEQAEVDRREWSPDREMLTGLLMHDEDNGVGLTGVPPAYWKVWEGLQRAGNDTG